MPDENARPHVVAGATLWDPDPARARLGVPLLEKLQAGLGITWPMQIHIDTRAEQVLGRRHSRGAVQGESVFIRPGQFDPRTGAGRSLLAHELAHAAQRRVPGPVGAPRAVAENEARQIAETFVASGRIVRPAVRLAGEEAAHDDDVTAREDELLKTPQPYKRPQVGVSGLTFTPQSSEQKWLGNIDRRLQAMAAVVKSLVGPAYSVKLVRETKTYMESVAGIQYINIEEGPAANDEDCKPLTMRTPTAPKLVEYFTKVHEPHIKVLLTADQIRTLQAEANLQVIYRWLRDHKWIVYPWYTETIFTGIMLHNRPLLEQFEAAWDDENKLIDVAIKRNDQLVPYELALSAIRRDPDLTDEPAYRALWKMPAKDPKSTEKLPPVDKTSEVDDRFAIEFLLDIQAHYTPVEIARATPDAAFRRKILTEWAVRMKLKKIVLEGDVSLRDAPAKAVQPPDPATMFSHPELEAPYYDRQAGTEMLFWMSVYTPNPWEHFNPWTYAWEVIRVPSDDWSKRDDVGQDPTAHGEDYGSFGRILGSRARRNLSNAEVDIKRSLTRIENIIGPPGMGPTSLSAGNAALSVIGSVIKTSFGKFSERPWEYTAAIKDPGVYVVRCRATRPEGQKTLIHKLPSVAYLPIWVRTAEAINADRVAVERAMAEVDDARLDTIQQKLKDPTLTDDERKELEKEATDLVASLHGDAETQLNIDLKKLHATQDDPERWAKLDKKEQDDLIERIATINSILEKRRGWVKDLGDEAVGTPQKLITYFTTQEGPSANRPLRLLLETMRMKSASGTFRYAVLDSTSKDSEHRVGPEKADRADAIAEAVRTLLEDVGYGRGTVTIAIPAGIWDVGAKKGETRTIDIERSDKQLALEGLENLALVTSIAAIAAAPFTGGESLALLIPIGVVGAIPAAYRLAHRASEGTFEWDISTAMDILNCVGAVAGLGQFASGLKLIQVSNRVWMIVGLGMDGLQGIVGTYDLIDKLKKIDPTLPEGARMAEAMQIVGNALLQLGIAIGGRLAAEGQARRARIEAKATPESNPNISRATPELTAPLEAAGIKDVPVFVDKSIEGPEVRVEFQKDGYGLPSDIQIIAGKGATAEMIRLHLESVQLLQKYSGLFGWIRTLVDRFNALVSSKQFVKPGSRGWIAAAEVNKLRGIIEHYSEQIRDGKVSRIDGEAYLKYLEQQMQRYEQALNEVEEGQGFIAAQAPKSADAQSHGYPPPPPNHYYFEEPRGVFQLRAHVGYDGQAKMVVPSKTGAGYDIVDRPPEAGVAAPGTTAAQPAPKAPRLDPAQLQLDISRALGVSSGYVDIVSESGNRPRVIPPVESGKGYIVHVPADATAGMVEAAVTRHRDLYLRRPSDLTQVSEGAKGKKAWNGALEAEYRGRPAAEEGYHWRLQDGKLQYVREAPEEGATAKPKMVWDETNGKLVPDTGAPEAKSWPDKPPTSKTTAFDDLGGNNPGSPFGKWVKLMEMLGFEHQALIDGLQDPTGLNYDTVRHNLKTQSQFQEAIRKWMTDAGELQKRYPDEWRGIDPGDAAKQGAALRKAQHRAVLEIDRYLALKDATIATENWYVEVFGQTTDVKGGTVAKIETQVVFDKDKLNAVGIDVSSTRQADVLQKVQTTDPKSPTATPGETNIIKEVKSHEGAVEAHDKEQFADYRKLVGKDVPLKGGTTARVDSVVEVFLDPRGGKANAEWIAGELSKPAGGVSFEVFNTKGNRKVFYTRDFQKFGNQAALAAAIIAFCDS